MASELEKALSAIPDGLLHPLIEQYQEALDASRSGRWETVGLKAGKICEIIFTIVDGYTTGSYATKPTKPKNMFDACSRLTKLDSSKFPRSVRLQIPRMICAVYELRNNRDIGHIGGDVVPNEMDGQFFLQSIKWLIAEIVRVFHQTQPEHAKALVDAVTIKSNSLIWESEDKIRVLKNSLRASDKSLIILYHISNKIEVKKLKEHVEYRNTTEFSKILSELHRKKYIEYDKKNRTVEILPPGIDYVEGNLLDIL